jgi:hypothetical protein
MPAEQPIIWLVCCWSFHPNYGVKATPSGLAALDLGSLRSSPFVQQDTQISAERTENIMDYNEQVQVFAQQEAHLRTVNNKTLFTALSAAGITRIIVSFDGYGDSGQIEENDAVRRRRTDSAS